MSNTKLVIALLIALFLCYVSHATNVIECMFVIILICSMTLIYRATRGEF